MNFTVSANELQKRLQIAAGAIGTNAVLPILEDFHLSLKGNELTISATDLETSVRTKMVVTGEGDGSTAIPAKILLDTLKALPEQPISFKKDANSGVEIRSSNGRYKAATDDPKDFPTFPTAKGDFKETAIGSNVLIDGLSRTILAVSTDELRLAMTGVLVIMTKTDMTFVATDAHKLVKYTFQVPSTATGQFILPKKTCMELKGNLPKTTEINFSFNKSNAFISFNETTIACRLIDAKYPDFNSVIPTSVPKILTINRASLLQSLKRTGIYANKATHQVSLAISVNSLKIEANDVDFSSEANEDVNCDFIGDPMTIAFNGRILIDLLGALNNEEVAIKMSEPNRAALITPLEDEEGQELVMLIMPVIVGK